MHNPRQEHESEMASAGGFLAGLVVGGLAGAGTALLLAPESGKKTRADIQHKGMELRDQTVETVENTVADAREKARQITTPARKQAKELQQRGQEVLEEQRDRVAQALARISPNRPRRDQNMKLSAPSQVVWIIAVVLGIVGILASLGALPMLAAYAFWLVVAGWALLVIATLMRNM